MLYTSIMNEVIRSVWNVSMLCGINVGLFPKLKIIHFVFFLHPYLMYIIFFSSYFYTVLLKIAQKLHSIRIFSYQSKFLLKYLVEIKLKALKRNTSVYFSHVLFLFELFSSNLCLMWMYSNDKYHFRFTGLQNLIHFRTVGTSKCIYSNILRWFFYNYYG